MRKVIIPALALCLLAACSSNAAQNSAASAPVTEVISPAVSDSTKAAPAETEAISPAVNSAQPISSDDLVISTEKGTLCLDMNMSDVIAFMGTDYQYAEAISCAYDGMDKTYIYGELEIYTYPDGEKDFVKEMVVKSADIKNSRGIAAGSTSEDVIAAYGSDYTTSGSLMVYTAEGSEIDFMIKDDIVEYIDIIKE